MGVSMPFFQNPWDILHELGPILEQINILYPNVPTHDSAGSITYMHSPQYSAAFEWKKRIENCSWKLPHVHEAIVRRQKISQGGPCCGMKDLCEVLYYIQALRPATVGKVLSGGWREAYETLVNDKICCIMNIDEQETIQGENTFPHIVEMPNFSTGGLLTFSYPNHRIPPISKIERPVQPWAFCAPSGGETKGGPTCGGLGSTSSAGKGAYDTLKGAVKFSYNIDPISNVFGPYTTIGERMIDSPLKTFKSIVCQDLPNYGNGPTIDFSGGIEACFMFPPVITGPHRTITLAPCQSQYMPPFFLPKYKINYIELGDGEEIGTYQNYIYTGGSLGCCFDPNHGSIAPLSKTSEETFLHKPCIGKEWSFGVNRDPRPW